MFFSSSTTSTLAMLTMVGERSCARELDREPAAAADLALEVDPPAVRLHDIAHDRKPEAGCATGLLALGESLEDPLALVGRDAGPAVLHGEAHSVTGGPERDLDRAAARRVSEG